MNDKIRKILDSKDKIPSTRLRNGKLWNFWQDDKYVRGLHRYCSFEDYKNNDDVDDIEWTTVLGESLSSNTSLRD